MGFQGRIEVIEECVEVFRNRRRDEFLSSLANLLGVRDLPLLAITSGNPPAEGMAP